MLTCRFDLAHPACYSAEMLLRRLRTLSLLIALALLGTTTTACTSRSCDTEIQTRLLNECRITFGFRKAICAGKSGEEPRVGTELTNQQKDYYAANCAILDPSGNPDCYATASCDDITLGKCNSTDSEMIEPATLNCLNACEQEHTLCLTACEKQAEFASCADCDLECTQKRVDCSSECD